jgi:hypothetical protein
MLRVTAAAASQALHVSPLILQAAKHPHPLQKVKGMSRCIITCYNFIQPATNTHTALHLLLLMILASEPSNTLHIRA